MVFLVIYVFEQLFLLLVDGVVLEVIFDVVDKVNKFKGFLLFIIVYDFEFKFDVVKDKVFFCQYEMVCECVCDFYLEQYVWQMVEYNLRMRVYFFDFKRKWEEMIIWQVMEWFNILIDDFDFDIDLSQI